MADALISPAVGISMLAISGGALACSVRELKKNFSAETIPLAGVMGAFVFAAQMINFAIPGTGSSGHIGGAVLLALLLGPAPAFLVTSSILFIQALLFADGGLLALGCNIFNIGFFGCFIAAPLIRRFAFREDRINKTKVFAASVAGCIVSAQLGSFCVVLETKLSGITALPFGSFLLLMQSIHLAIGAVEGILTASLLLFLYQANPALAKECGARNRLSGSMGRIAGALILAALVIGGGISLLASGKPDGLEWSIEHAGKSEISSSGTIHQWFAALQQKLALLPDYGFAGSEGGNAGTAFSGVAGALLTLLFIAAVCWTIKKLFRRKHAA